MKLRETIKSATVYNTNSRCTSNTSDIIEKGSESAFPKEPWIKCRYTAILMGFIVNFYFLAHRVTMSVSIVEMVNYTALPQEMQKTGSCWELVTNSTVEDYSVQSKRGKFEWTPEIQGYILGISFLFQFFAILPAGNMCESYGCKKILLWGLILSSAFSFLSPFAAWYNVYLLMFVQGLRGLFQRPNTPWLKMLTSVPIWALAYGFVGQLWALAICLTVYPIFLATILHYPILDNGMISSLPPLMAFFGTFSSGWISMALERKKYMSTNISRKFFSSVSFFGWSVCFLGVYFAGCNRLLSAIFFMISLGLYGFSSAGIWVVPTDMSPTFAGSINSVITISFATDFIVPVIIGYLTTDQTIEQWNIVFMISIIVITSSGVIFAIFGSAEVQPWNNVSKDEKEETDQESKF